MTVYYASRRDYLGALWCDGELWELVTVEGVDYQIVDIGMRMLEPHELLAAQFGRFAPTYDLSPARTKTAKVRLIGNSVCPEMAEALVRANLNDVAAVEVA